MGHNDEIVLFTQNSNFEMTMHLLFSVLMNDTTIFYDTPDIKKLS